MVQKIKKKKNLPPFASSPNEHNFSWKPPWWPLCLLIPPFTFSRHISSTITFHCSPTTCRSLSTIIPWWKRWRSSRQCTSRPFSSSLLNMERLWRQSQCIVKPYLLPSINRSLCLTFLCLLDIWITIDHGAATESRSPHHSFCCCREICSFHYCLSDLFVLQWVCCYDFDRFASLVHICHDIVNFVCWIIYLVKSFWWFYYFIVALHCHFQCVCFIVVWKKDLPLL